MMKRRFTTILAGVLAGNTAFFATQAIATQEMQPTMQATDRYMIIDLAGIPLDQAQNNVDALIPDDTHGEMLVVNLKIGDVLSSQVYG